MTWKHFIVLPFVILLIRQLILYLQDPSKALERVEAKLKNVPNVGRLSDFKVKDEIVIAAVACGGLERLEELSVMMKSAIIFSQSRPLKFIIFTDNLASDIEKILKYWKQHSKQSLSWDIRPPLYPPLSEDQDSIRTTFAPCATQRLFFPLILPEYQHILYVDTDIIFLQDPVHVWTSLDNMASKSFGLITENNASFYSAYSYSSLPHPENGLNSGVMLMNLDRMRYENWHEKIMIMFSELKSYMAFCDQDMVNLYSYYYPNELYELPCSANFRPDFCLTQDSCQVDKEILILHGNRAAFHDNWQFGGSFFTSYLPKMMSWFLFKNLRLVEYAFAINKVMSKQEIFQNVYQSINNFEVKYDDLSALKYDLIKRFEAVSSSDLCYHIHQDILNLIAG